MKRLFALLLVLVSMFALVLPVVGGTPYETVSSPEDCPVGTIANDIGDGRYECVPDENYTPPEDNNPPEDNTPPEDYTPPENNNTPENNNENHNTPVVTTFKPAPTGTVDPGISFNDSDLGVVLYEEQDADGNSVLAIYDMLNDGEHSSFMFKITQDDLAPFVAHPPSENTLLNARGHVAVYVLTTGEIQINVGPDSEGKTHVKVFDGIPWLHVYGYVIDPA